ncbi:MAG TPA: hypothetical protein VFH43_01820 [Candidatus Kapabacteria bacterium]|nr:hypothetical protein [Candidatus Kapabacteria bacterium]
MSGGVVSNSGVLSVTGTPNEIIATPTTGHVIVSLPDTVNANITGNAATATWASTAQYADSAGTASSVTNTLETGNAIINAINSADSNIHYWALDEIVLLQTEVV